MMLSTSTPLRMLPLWRRWCCVTRAWVLGLLTLAVLGASASPLLNPQALQLVCSAGGSVRWVATAEASLSAADSGNQDQDQGPAAGHALECALCLGTGLLPHLAGLSDLPPGPAARAEQGATNERAPDPPSQFPARGPPARA